MDPDHPIDPSTDPSADPSTAPTTAPTTAPATAAETATAARDHAEPTIAEDVLQLLFQPASGTIAGEGTLFYVLGGAVLAELALRDLAAVEDAGIRGTLVRAVGATPPADDLLRATWESVADKPRGVQTVLAATGPRLRAPVLDRLVERGEVLRERGRVLGIIPTERLTDGATGRRDALLAELRAVLVDGAEPSDRTAALAALLSASGALPWFDREIPWGSAVAERALALQHGDWGAAAAASAVTRTMTAIVVNAMLATTVTTTR